MAVIGIVPVSVTAEFDGKSNGELQPQTVLARPYQKAYILQRRRCYGNYGIKMSNNAPLPPPPPVSRKQTILTSIATSPYVNDLHRGLPGLLNECIFKWDFIDVVFPKKSLNQQAKNVLSPSLTVRTEMMNFVSRRFSFAKSLSVGVWTMPWRWNTKCGDRGNTHAETTELFCVIWKCVPCKH